MDTTQRRPAIVPADHPLQRYFSETRHRWSVRGASVRDHTPNVRVYRNAEYDAAELTIDMLGTFEARAALDASALRRLASDLLDAADDIERHPAARLVDMASRAAAAS